MTTPIRKRKTKNPAAVALGRRGGSVTSPAKAAAARRNGKKGGRPRDLELFVDAFELGQLIAEAQRLYPDDVPKLNRRAQTFNEMVQPVEEWAKREVAKRARRPRKGSH